MNDEILKLAKECGITHNTWDYQDKCAVEAFYRAAFNAGIEAAAKECESLAGEDPIFKSNENDYPSGWLDASNECGWAIRALKGKK